jgi:hypothetical protein
MNGTISSTIYVGGVVLQSTKSRTAGGQIGLEESLPAGNAGTLSTRTDDNTGVVTLGEGHGLAVNDVVDLYWAAGLRYGMTVTAVNGNAVSVDGGTGDVLPAQGTAIVCTKVVDLICVFDGDLLSMIAAQSDKRSHIVFRSAVPADIEAVELTANEDWEWVIDTVIQNPLAGGDVATVRASNGDSAAAATLKVGVLYDSD